MKTLFTFLLICISLNLRSQIIGGQQVIQVPTTQWATPANALLSLPDDYNTNQSKYPLILFLHGWGESGTDINKLITTALPQRIAQGFKPQAVNPKDGKVYKFIVVSPQAPDFSFQYGHIKIIMNDLLKRYRIDTDRIYITGLSAGGFGVWTCVTDDIEFSKGVAAISPISSMAVDGNRPNIVDNAARANLPVWSICGMADDKWAIAVDYTNKINALNPAVPAKLTGIPNVGHSAWNQAYDPNWKVDNLNLYEWLLQYKRGSNIIIDEPKKDTIKVPQSRGKRFYVAKGSDGGKYISGKTTTINPGDTIVLKASAGPFSYLSLENIYGTAENPIVIINEGGQVRIAAMAAKNSRYLKFTGSGSSDKYGFYMTSEIGKGTAWSVSDRSSHIEIERSEIKNETYMIWAKHEADCVDSLQYPNWWLDNISFHDNKGTNIGQDAIYFGSTSPNGLRSIVCNGVTKSPIPMRLSNIKIYNNIIDSVGRTAIQVSGADSGANEIYNNFISRVGYELNQTQGSGIISGGKSHIYIHHNYIRQTFQNGIFILGSGLNRVEYNDIDSSGYLGSIINNLGQPTGILVDTRSTVPMENTLLQIKNNKLGKNAVIKGEHIIVQKSFNTYDLKNEICGNTSQTGVAATIYVAPGIDWNRCGIVIENQPPQVNAGSDKEIQLPTSSIELIATGGDPDGHIVAVLWKKISGPTSNKILTPLTDRTTISNLVAGVYVFEISATDNKGATSKDTITITVRPVRKVIGTIRNKATGNTIRIYNDDTVEITKGLNS